MPLTPQAANFPGWENQTHGLPLASAMIVPAGLRTVATAGLTGVDVTGKLAESKEAQVSLAFENVEKAILAAAPELSKEEAWASVYNITTYHMGGVGGDAIKPVIAVFQQKFQGRQWPAWTAVGVETLAVGGIEVAVLAAVP